MAMKMIFAVVHDDDTNKTVKRLNENKFRVTKLSSTGGFLKRGNTTLMIGVEDDQVETVLKILEQECAKRKQIEVTTPYPQGDLSMISYSYIPITVEVGGATVFVLDVEQFRRI
nr:cyclic-di-AMP receptor [uncultured Sellimonas sp.]